MGIRKYRKNIGKYIVADNGVSIFLIEDCYISSRDKCAYFLVWDLKNKNFTPILCIEIKDSLEYNKYSYISAEEANKITLKYGYNCIRGEYFLTEEQKRELEMLYGVKVDN